MAYAGDIITDSFNKTKELFFPIRKQYWLKMGFISLMAGNNGGGSYNGSSPGTSNKGFPSGMTFKQVIAEINSKSLAFLSQYGYLVGIGVILLYFLGLILSYLSSIFTFVFIDGIVKKDIEIKKSFSEYKGIGMSLFLLKLVVGLISLAVSIAIFYPVIEAFFQNRLADFNFWLIIPMVLGLVMYSIPIGLFIFLVDNMVVPIMYTKKISFTKAWVEFRKIASGNKLEIVLYWLLKIALSIVAALGSLIIFIPFFIIILLLGLIGVLLYLVIKLAAGEIAAIGVILVLAFFAIMTLIYLFSIVYVPVPAFFRIYSLEMVKKLEESKLKKPAVASEVIEVPKPSIQPQKAIEQKKRKPLKK